jgi:hypothetical protein
MEMGFSAPPNVETGLIYGVQRPEAPRASSREVEVTYPQPESCGGPSDDGSACSTRLPGVAFLLFY